MIVPKKKQQVEETEVQVPVVDTFQTTTESEAYDGNPMADIYRAVESIIKNIPKDPKNPNGERYFKTVKWNHGQLSRIKNGKLNEEYGNIAFPAVFVHFINVRGLVQTSRIGEFRADMRIQYVLNRLNSGDDEFQTEGAEVFQLINTAINKNKDKFTSLTERCQFTYWDQPEVFSDGLQQYWITYEVWFRDYSAYRYRDYVDVYVVAPPFTNHSDQQEQSNPDNHDNHHDTEHDNNAAGFQVP